MGVLSAIDADALAAYCQAYARWQAAEEFLAKHGDTYPVRDENGRVRFVRQFPQVTTARTLLNTLRAFQQEFGMTPSSRTRIEVSPSYDPDDEEERVMAEILGPP
jgi:P27 family predicted phage terminase small subunit